MNKYKKIYIVIGNVGFGVIMLIFFLSPFWADEKYFEWLNTPFYGKAVKFYGIVFLFQQFKDQLIDKIKYEITLFKEYIKY